MILSFAAAAAVIVSAAGDSARVRVNVAGLNRSAAHAAIGDGARRACRAIAYESADYADCVADAVRRGRQDYQRLQARRPLLVAGAR